MKQYYECHITMMGNPQVIKPHVDTLKWKFSTIDGDPDLGAGVKCYATRHFNKRYSEEYVATRLKIASSILEVYGFINDFKVLRRKIELVIYDGRIDK